MVSLRFPSFLTLVDAVCQAMPYIYSWKSVEQISAVTQFIKVLSTVSDKELQKYFEHFSLRTFMQDTRFNVLLQYMPKSDLLYFFAQIQLNSGSISSICTLYKLFRCHDVKRSN